MPENLDKCLIFSNLVAKTSYYDENQAPYPAERDDCIIPWESILGMVKVTRLKAVVDMT